MKKAPAKYLILILAIGIMIAVAGSSFALAIWAGSPEQAIDNENATEVDYSENPTTKYLVFRPIGNFNDEYCLEYTDSDGWKLKFENGSDYVFNGGNHKAGVRNAVTDNAEIAAVHTATTNVSVIGYYGALGEYEPLYIPSTITWNSKTINVTKIDIIMTEYEDSMNLITDVVIPASVALITGQSFTGAGNLAAVHFEATTVPTIGDYAFRGMSSGIAYYKKNEQGEYVPASIVRS